jgi:hypothetical protein
MRRLAIFFAVLTGVLAVGSSAIHRGFTRTPAGNPTVLALDLSYLVWWVVIWVPVFVFFAVRRPRPKV